ncbi:MAG: hypothetical protein K940chlam7_02025, partial [Chlamydiae bacterium]|nr:hypothetical protein [Chlamydiota bacterium]
FPNEKTLNHWLADEAAVDIWEIEDLRGEKPNVFCKLQRAGEWGYDTFETKDKLFDQLREDYGVLWKLEDPESYQTTYIRYNTGLFGSSYDHVAHENLIYVADSLEFGAPNRATPSTSDRASWGKSIAACLLGGLLISAGRSWESNQNNVSDAIAMMKGTLGPAALKTAFVFQMSMIAAMIRHEGGALPGALLAGMLFLPEPVQGQSLCPQLVGSYDTPDWTFGVALSGNYAYVADGGSGIQIIDVSNVANATLVGFYDTPSIAFGVALSGNYAYVADAASGLQIIDVSNVANPTLAGSYDTLGEAYAVAVSGNYAYVADWDSGLQIIDVSNVTNPTLAGSYDTIGRAYGVAVSGNYAYVADAASGLQIIDVSNVTTPSLAGSYNTSGTAYGVALSGNYAYVADWDVGGLQIIDVSNVANPTLAGSYNTPDIARGVALFGNYAYVADWTSGLQIIDVSNVANPTLAGSYDTPGYAPGVAVSGNYAYVADGSSGLQIIDISCPSLTSSSSSTSSPTTRSSTSPSTTIPTPSSSTTRSSTSSSITIPTPSSSTSRSSTSLLAPTLQSTTTTLFLSADSTKTKTPIFISTTGISSPDTPSFLWIVGLAAGGALCLGLTGGTVLILRRRRQSSNNAPSLIEQGSKAHDSFVMEPVIERHKKIGRQYYQLSKISKEEAREVYEQTSHLIVFPEGEKKFKYVLGKGNFGAIKVAQRIEDQKYVASKKVKGEENIRASEEEADMQKEAAGDNVLPIYNTIRLEETLYHFMPLAGFGNGREVQSHLSALHNPMLATEILKFVVRDILTGLKTMHEKGIYHLDIKPENIVFTKDGTGYITDFGCAKKVKGSQISHDAIGDNRYFSPERLQACKERS